MVQSKIPCPPRSVNEGKDAAKLDLSSKEIEEMNEDGNIMLFHPFCGTHYTT